jgi:hypothetical protein
MQIDTRVIYLTPNDEIPICPQPGSMDYWNFMTQRPLFIFDKDGYTLRSHLLPTMIALYESVFTALDWASEIPNIKAQRAAKPNASKSSFDSLIKPKVPDVDVSTGQHIMYCVILIVQADIRRGCKLAKIPARHLVRHTQAEFENHLIAHSRRLCTSGIVSS